MVFAKIDIEMMVAAALPEIAFHPKSIINGTHQNGLPLVTSHDIKADRLAASSVSLNPVPAYTSTRKLRVVTIGAGYSGLTLAYKLQHEYAELQADITHTIYEARNDIGGTWLVNTYPGVVCDVPSHIYAFPFDPNPDWSHFYSSGPEIWEYMRKTVDKWHLDRDVKLNHRVIGANWQEERGQWKVRIKTGESEFDDFADILISGQGFLNNWKWPDIPGLQNFKGHKVHSANWDHGFDYRQKKIAIIGNGSSGIQILPQMAQLEGTHITSFQRSPTWVVATFSPATLLGKDDPAFNPAYTEEEKRNFRENPGEHNKYRKKLIHNINAAFKMFLKGSSENIAVYKLAANQMAEKLQHRQELCDALIPKWELGCRRITPGEGYLESFLLPNVELTQSPIVEVTETGIRTADGKFHEVDIVVCATGFDVSYRPPYPIVGRNGVELGELWSKEPISYMSLACPHMPNYFLFTGPNATIGHGSLMESLGWTAAYIIKWMKKILEEDIKAIVPKEQAVADFVAYEDQIHKTLVWSGGCRSWYKNSTIDGRVIALFGGSALLYRRLISNLRPEDFEIEFRSANRYRFLGNGFTEYELERTNDLAWYVEK